MPKRIDLSGQRFGRLTVIERAENSKGGKAQWLCKCDCGNETIVAGDKLRKKHSKSCGCLRSIITKASKTIHGGRKTRLYNIWSKIKERCYNPHSKSFSNYGGSGIAMYEEWRTDFTAFRDWALSNGYADNFSIDRININGNYEPSNCRWVDKTTQANNRKTNRTILYNGETHTLAEWQRITGISQSTIKTRLNAGWPIERALTETPHK